MKHSISRLMYSLFTVGLVSALLAGCGAFGSRGGIDYRSAAKDRVAPLEVPPELSTPATDDRFAVPDSKPGTATYSTYTRGTGGTVAPVAAGVLPTNAVARVERNQDARYLVVKLEADKVWPVVREFWQETGFTLKLDNQGAGVMETDWAENRAKIPQDPIRNVVGRVLDNIYSTGQMDKFRTRLERTPSGETEIYVSHRGVEEVFVSTAKDQTKWAPRAVDRELEAEMLNRLLVKFGTPTERAASMVAGATPQASAAPAATLEENGTRLRVNDSFDRAWRRVGLALDRGGFTVEDRDRSKGLFFVRYIDPDYDVSTGDKKGWLDKLAFWRPAPKPGDRPAFRVLVAQAGDAASLVQVQNPAGEAETGATGKRMLSVLADQLR